MSASVSRKIYNHRCRFCSLHQGAKTVCMEASGTSATLRAMVVGEAPGRNEDARGMPFVGEAGKLLDTALEEAFGSLWSVRDDIVVTNVVKCRPPGNMKPTRKQMQACFQYLKAEIHEHDPVAILALGNSAIESLLGRSGITSLRGNWQKLDRPKETWVMPAFHPAYIGYQGGVTSDAYRLFLEDVQLFANKVTA